MMRARACSSVPCENEAAAGGCCCCWSCCWSCCCCLCCCCLCACSAALAASATAEGPAAPLALLLAPASPALLLLACRKEAKGVASRDCAGEGPAEGVEDRYLDGGGDEPKGVASTR